MPESRTPTYDALKPKEKAFVDAFIAQGFCATKAGRVCKLKDPMRGGWELRRKQEISQAIDERLREGRASADMIRARLEDHAFSSMGDSLRFDLVSAPTQEKPDNKVTVASLDLNKMRRKGKLHLISKIKQRTWWDKSKDAEVKEIEVEAYSAQAALLALGKGHGIFEKEEKPAENNQGGVTRVPMRGQLSEEERAQAANELEPRT